VLRCECPVHSALCDEWTCRLTAYMLLVLLALPNGGFAYYTTMPTDALGLFRDAGMETKARGLLIICTRPTLTLLLLLLHASV